MINKENFLKFLKEYIGESIDTVSSSLYYIGGHIFLSDLKDGDNYNVEFFNDFGNMYFLDLRKLKNLLDDGDKNFYAVYFSIGKYKKYKKYSRKKEFGILLCFTEFGFKCINNNKFEGNIGGCESCYIEFNQRLFQKADLNFDK